MIYPRRGPRCSWAVSCGSQGQPNPSASHSYDWPVVAVWGLRSFNFGSLRFVRPGMRELIEQANWLRAPDGGFYLNLRLFGPDDSLKNGTGCRRKSKSFSHPKDALCPQAKSSAAACLHCKREFVAPVSYGSWRCQNAGA